MTTLREDFLSYALQYPKLADLSQTQTGTFPLTRPDDSALREIIRRPAERVGLAVEDDLVEEMVRDAGTDVGALPLVAFCLEELWQSIDRGAPQPRMTLAAYKNIGGLQGAIAKCADKVLEDLRRNEGPDFDTKLHMIFSTLVAVEAGRAIRRRVPRVELVNAGQLVDELINHRLLCARRNKIELTQDALLDRWPTLKGWIDAHRTDMIHAEQLRAAAYRWSDAPRREKHAYLWHSYRLKAAKELVHRWHYGNPAENATIISFIKASETRRWRDIGVLCAAGAAASVLLTVMTLRYITPSLVPRTTMPVGSYPPNNLGLLDMHGNVWEWTQDCLERTAGVVTFCKARGGSWDNHEKWKLRADYWEYLPEDLRAPTVGFRVMRELGDEEDIKDCEPEKKCPRMVIIKNDGAVTPQKQRPSEEDTCPADQAASSGGEVKVKSLAIGEHEITVAEWNECVSGDGDYCKKKPEGKKQNRPVTNVSHEDAKDYTRWLSDTTKKSYRLPTSNEWEYAVRGGDNDRDCYHWGNDIGKGNANCSACGLTWRQLFDSF